MESSVTARAKPPGRRRPITSNSNNANSDKDLSNPSSRTSSPAPATTNPALPAHPQTTKTSPSNQATLSTTDFTPSASTLHHSERANINIDSEVDQRQHLINALRDCDKEELVKALTDAKDQIEQLDSSLESTTLSLEESQAFNATLSAKVTSIESYSTLLQHSLSEREARITEISSETSSLEQDLFSSTSLIERLRFQLKEAEQAKMLAEKYQREGDVSADKERQYYKGLEEMMEKLKQSHSASMDKYRKENGDLERELSKLRDRLDESESAVNSNATALSESESVKSTCASADDKVPFSATLTTAPPLTSSATTSNGLGPEHVSTELLTLRSELAHLHKSHSNLSSTLHQLQSELKEVKISNEELKDECETYRDILQEKTFSGALLAESAVLSGWKGKGGLSGGREGVVRGVFADHQGEGDEDEDDEEGQDDESQDRVGDDDQSKTKDLDDVDDVPDTPRAQSMTTISSDNKRRSGKKINGRKSERNLMLDDIPRDLATELEGKQQTDGDTDEVKQKRLERKRDRMGEVSDDVAVLQKEVFELRDANKALTLYISKIIDRIVAKEGYESVLAADDDRSGKKAAGVGSMRRKAQSQSQRGSILPASPVQKPDANSETLPASGNNALKNARRQSGSFLNLVGRATGVSEPPSTNTNANNTATNTTTSPQVGSVQGQNSKRRTASIDWRSLLPGGGTPSASSSNSPDANLNPNLRPFSLQASSGIPSGAGNRASMSSASPSSIARRLAPTEEVEDATDKFERERIRAKLQAEGITPPEHQLRPNIITRPSHTSTQSTSGLGAFLQRVVSGSGSSGSSSEAQSNVIDKPPSNIRTSSFDGPKLTTFDDPSPSRPQTTTESPVGDDNLTEYIRPVRNARNSNRSNSNASSLSRSRSSSVGGDESYGLPS